MKRTVWVSLASTLVACSGSAQDGNASEPGDGSTPRRITAQACEMEYPIKSWDDYTSKYGFCERLGFRLQYCEKPRQSDEDMCGHLKAAERLRVEIADECMTQEFDVSKVPEMIKTLEECVCGDRWETENICKFAECEERFSCFRAAGFKWTSRRRQATATKPENHTTTEESARPNGRVRKTPDWVKSGAYKTVKPSGFLDGETKTKWIKYEE